MLPAVVSPAVQAEDEAIGVQGAVTWDDAEPDPEAVAAEVVAEDPDVKEDPGLVAEGVDATSAPADWAPRTSEGPSPRPPLSWG